MSTALWQGVVDAARAHDINLLSFVGEALESPYGFKSLANALYDLVSPHNVDGLLFWNSALSNYVPVEAFQQFRERFSSLPMVDVEETPENVKESYSYRGMRLAIRHLIEEHDCRRIAFIRGPEGNCEAEFRYQAYRDLLDEYELPFEHNLVTPPGRWKGEWATEAMDLLFEQRKVRFDGMAAPSDLLAVTAIEALQNRGVRIPEDVAVVGIDDSIEGRCATPALTTVPYSLYSIGQEGVRRLLARITNDAQEKEREFPLRLKVRRSCGCIPPSVAQAAVGNTAVSKDSYTAIRTQQREKIVSEMLGVFGASTKVKRAWLESVFEAFFLELEDNVRLNFLQVFDEMLCRTMSTGEDVAAWQGVLSLFCRRVSPTLQERDVLLYAEDLWQQARVMIAEAVQRDQGYRKLQEDSRSQMLRKISARLISTFDVGKLMDILAEELPRLGISRAYVALYDDPERPAEQSHWILAYSEHGRMMLENHGKSFPSHQLAPETAFRLKQRYSMVVTPLYFESHLGFALFESGPREGSIYGVLSGQISSALQGALLVQRVHAHMAEITRQQYILDTFMDTVPDRIYFKDCEGLITRANRAHAARIGLGDPAEEVGKTDFDFFPQEQALTRYQQEQTIIRTGSPLMNIEEEIPLSEDRTAWSLTTKMPLRNEHGEIIGIFGISRDITDLKRAEQELQQYRSHLEELVKERTEEITRINVCLSDEIVERKRVEQALRVSEQQYRLLAENVKNGVIIVQDEKIVFVNEVFADMLGYSVHSILQRQPAAFFPENLDHSVTSNLEGDISANSPPQIELVTREGMPVWTEIERSSIIWDTQPALLLTIRNINQSKLRELQLEEERARLRQENLMFKSSIRDRFRFGELVGKSPAMQRVYELIVSAATSDVNVLISGDSGTGKELIARTIYQVSSRKNRAFVPVNCASIPETLFEREFFGHRRGSFTGADRDQPGFFDRAHQGILFLDEVTELSSGMQAKLLRVLQDGEYAPLGSNTPKQADVMIVAATNKEPREEITEGRLRKDFFYRVGVIEIAVPSLQERKEDLPFLIEHILDQHRQKHGEFHGTAPHEQQPDQTMLPGELVQALYNYSWPGNVRELQNVLQRYLATNDLGAILRLISTSRGRSAAQYSEAHPESLSDALAALEKQMLLQALARTGYNTQQAAKQLQIPLHTFYRRMKKYHIANAIGAQKSSVES